ncbi:hypothetical protein GDO81_009984 [Engystomops pustulosus]|uniref:Uncharacterized protein n=1 Tax=Engystomops pustulosus TaxID=76066 RepID=A0AAV7BW51_ENGPU|nr:hypothetical protein GDO81_009984 [Engystomops pustulosus]
MPLISSASVHNVNTVQCIYIIRVVLCHRWQIKTSIKPICFIGSELKAFICPEEKNVCTAVKGHSYAYIFVVRDVRKQTSSRTWEVRGSARSSLM